MNWPMTLLAYVARRFMLSVLIVVSVFAVLAFSIDLADMFRRTSERDVATAIVFSMSALKLPTLIQQLFPFAVLFGAIFSFAKLSRSHELVAARAAGVSAWQFLHNSSHLSSSVFIFSNLVVRQLEMLKSFCEGSLW